MEGCLRRTPTWTRSTSSALPFTTASRTRLEWCSPRPQPYVSHSTSMGRRSHREHTHTPPTTTTHASSPLHSLITFPSPTLTARCERHLNTSFQLIKSIKNQSINYKRATFYNAIKSNVGLVLAKAAALRITLNLDGAPIPARTYAHPSHNTMIHTNSRLISTALSHHVPLPQAHST